MPEEPKKKKGCLGCSFPVAIGVSVFLLFLLFVGFAAGPLGMEMLGDLGLPEWMKVDSPHVQLPAETVFHIFGFPIANSVIAAWVTIAVLSLFSFFVCGSIFSILHWLVWMVLERPKLRVHHSPRRKK